MNYKIKGWTLFGRIAGIVAVVVLLIYTFSVGSFVGNRVDESVAGTAWVSRDDKIAFVSEDDGFYYTASDKTYSFTYQMENGYIICKEAGDDVLLELLKVSNYRMFSVRSNTIYYDEATL